MPDLTDYGDGALIDKLAAMGPDDPAVRPVLLELRSRLRHLRLLSVFHERATGHRFLIERLPNGFIRVFDYAAKWSSLFDAATGKYHSGNLFAGTHQTIYDLGLLAPPDEVTHGPR